MIESSVEGKLDSLITLKVVANVDVPSHLEDGQIYELVQVVAINWANSNRIQTYLLNFDASIMNICMLGHALVFRLIVMRERFHAVVLGCRR